MKKINIKLVAIILPALLTLPMPASTNAMEMGEEDEYVEFTASAEMIMGHLSQAIENKYDKELELAKAHAGHPISELYALMEEKLSNRTSELNTALKERLEQLPNRVDTLSATDFENEVSEIEMMLNDAVADVVPQELRHHALTSKVIIELVETAEHEYEEGVSDGKVVQMVEYQDAWGFVDRAHLLFLGMSEIEEDDREEIRQFFTDLKNAMSAEQDPGKIETFIDAIVNESKESAGIEMEMSTEPSIANIKALLESLVDEYDDGEYEEAEQLAVKSYLDNYEFLEAEIEAKDPELMESTEIMLREELRNLIKDRASVEEVEVKVQEIKANLDKILAMGIGVSTEAEGDARLAYVKNIRMLLDEAVEEYEEGKYDEATSYAVKAYLDNYEYLEKDVGAQDEELNGELEHMLRNELQEKIKNHVPVSEIKALASEINTRLDTVEAIVPEFPVGLTVMMASVMGIMVAFLRMRKSAPSLA